MAKNEMTTAGKAMSSTSSTNVSLTAVELSRSLYYNNEIYKNNYYDCNTTHVRLTIPRTTKKVTIPREMKTANTLIEILPCLMYNNLTIIRHPTMYIKAVSVICEYQSYYDNNVIHRLV